MVESGRAMLQAATGGSNGFARPSRLNRGLAGVLILSYLAAMGVFLTLHALGDTPPQPVAYFFTWDMFPGFFTESLRRIAVGKTASGHYVQLLPGAYQQYRGGVNNALTHIELDREGAIFRATAIRAIELANVQGQRDPIVHVYLLERYWPDKFNYSAERYREWFGTEKPDRHSWRLQDEFDVPLQSPTQSSPKL